MEKLIRILTSWININISPHDLFRITIKLKNEVKSFTLNKKQDKESYAAIFEIECWIMRNISKFWEKISFYKATFHFLSWCLTKFDLTQ